MVKIDFVEGRVRLVVIDNRGVAVNQETLFL
jgi:hypothetical protein